MGSWKRTSKMRTAAVLLFVASAAAASEKVPYTTLKKFDGYEMRQYPSVKWVCTELTYPLEEETAVISTEPQSELDILKSVQERWNDKDRKKKPQANPPTPVDPAVKIEENEEFTVFVHTFGGYAMKDSVWIEQAKVFAEVLAAAGEDVDTSTFYSAGYDSPMKFWNRRNEVMYLVPGNKLPNVL